LTAKGDSPLERYFSALESIAASTDGRSVSDIALSCDLPIATAHRLLQNLQHAGLVASTGTKRRDYRLGKRLLRLLHAGSDTAWLSISVQPLLDKLANELSETCYLARLVGHEVVSVAWAAPSEGLRGYVVPGHACAPHVAASAKAILAFQSQDLIDRALVGTLPKLTAKTKTRRKDIDRDYQDVRDTGYATCWDEMEIGMGAIAVPIPLPEVGTIYSLAAAGLIDRLTRRPVAKTVSLLQATLEPMIRALKNREPDADLILQANDLSKMRSTDFNREGIPSSGEFVGLPIDEGGKRNMDRRIKRRFTS
jgi:DNA-binding IclR family transcriptional regulator